MVSGSGSAKPTAEVSDDFDPIHTILVPLDLTERVEAIVEWAIGWALMTHARLELLHVVTPLNDYTVDAYPDQERHYVQALDAARQRLLPLAQLAEARGIETSIRVELGPPTEEILAVASATNTGLIIVGTHGRKGLAHVVLGLDRREGGPDGRVSSVRGEGGPYVDCPRGEDHGGSARRLTRAGA